jgi:hypothetical protein
MPAMTDFILHLIAKPYQTSKPLRVSFFLDPYTAMSTFTASDGSTLTDEEMSVIASLDYRLILEYIDAASIEAKIRAFVDHNDDDNDWPEVGDPRWDPWANGGRCNPGVGPMVNQGILWSGPRSGITWMFKDSAARGDTFDLRFAGEGLLPNPLVVLRQRVAPHRKLNATATDYIPCNIRRSYVAATFTIPDDPVLVGSYDLVVSNKGWKKHKLYGNLTFTIS